ncbi:hypothetical protein E2C01_010995 [Portunus trituberculatus]|uniref:Uncharacterized protein n=1 Tax=Portunus trituberculatus TaxID=210409 RepID=A0A5B7D9W9_PORTR|nr:hypothetical protein [Portunus trituberculatus]
MVMRDTWRRSCSRFCLLLGHHQCFVEMCQLNDAWIDSRCLAVHLHWDCLLGDDLCSFTLADGGAVSSSLEQRLWGRQGRCSTSHSPRNVEEDHRVHLVLLQDGGHVLAITLQRAIV